MKILNFTAVEVLPSLLDKTKTQTIRLAWKEIMSITCHPEKGLHKHFIEKPARFKVGEKVQLVWNQRSKFKWFCVCGGKGETKEIFKNTDRLHQNIMPPEFKEHKVFNKLLGTAEITEVFKIEMCKANNGDYFILEDKRSISHFLYSDYTKDIAKRDGFKSAEEMFNWFNKKYDLSQLKEFWVYRWKYIV